jgi:hypothetical protein
MANHPTAAGPSPDERESTANGVVVPIQVVSRRRAEAQAACLRIRPWRTTARLDCASDFDCDPDKLCVNGICV